MWPLCRGSEGPSASFFLPEKELRASCTSWHPESDSDFFPVHLLLLQATKACSLTLGWTAAKKLPSI